MSDKMSDKEKERLDVISTYLKENGEISSSTAALLL